MACGQKPLLSLGWSRFHTPALWRYECEDTALEACCVPDVTAWSPGDSAAVEILSSGKDACWMCSGVLFFSLNREQPGLGGVLSHGLHIVCQIKNAPPGSNSTNTIHRSSSGTEIRSAACLASVISLLLNTCSYSKLMRSTHVQKFLLLL